MALVVVICGLLAVGAGALDTPKAHVSNQMIDVGNGIVLDVAIAGTGSTPMVLFHGYPETAWLWRGVIDPLLEDPALKLFMPNQRGYNHSSKPEGIANYNMSLLVDDAVGLLEAVSHGTKAHLVGHDWGGMMVAWCVAGRHPDLVSTLSIINSPHPGVYDGLIRHSAAQQKDSSYQFFFDTQDADMMAPENDFKGESWFDSETQAALKAAWEVPGSRRGALNWYRANIFAGRMNVKEFTPDMPTGVSNYTDMVVNVPTLVMWASGDPYFDMAGNLGGLRKFVPMLTVKTQGYENLGHWVAQAAPSTVAADIRAFISNASVQEMLV